MHGKLCTCWLSLSLAVSATNAAELAAALGDLSPEVLTAKQRETASEAIERDLRRRQDAANARNLDEWNAIANREQWERYRDERLARLKASLGTWPATPNPLPTRVTSRVEGDGYVIENVIYESRPDDWVTGNLYRPADLPASMPGILIAHAHHHGKNHGELQDMGMTWARAGCSVLVIDQAGYGERRAHPFQGPDDYAHSFRVGRQDYYYRYDSGVQLQLAGESLMGWMVWDLMRGVDLLLARPGIDPERLIILGAVAGGGDPCGITAALDRRIAAAVPFNFGGPQPETRYPLPDDAEISFNYLMGSYWDSTRGLRRTVADGCFHWTITSAIAPRRLIHAHEFSWDGERDPVWRRYQRTWGEFYGVPELLAVAHGKGLLSGSAPEASHCGQIGRFHRRMIHPVFRRWFGIEVDENDEFSARRDPEDLICLPPAVRAELHPAALPELVSRVAEQRVAQARGRLASLDPAAQRDHLRSQWRALLGNVNPTAPARVISSHLDAETPAGFAIRRVVLETEPDVLVPLLLVSPDGHPMPAPAVVAVAQGGKAGFLEHRSADLAALVNGGALVCLPDLRGTGESAAGTSRDRTSGDTNRSVNMQLHSETILGQRLRDLRSVIAWLRERDDVDPARISLWGDSFAPPNPPETDFDIPHEISGRPRQPEPLGGLLALLGAQFDEDMQRVFVRGGLSSWRTALRSPHVYLPHDVAVPGALTAGELCDLAAALAPRPLRIDSPVDALNRPLTPAHIAAEYRPAEDSYRKAEAAPHLVIGSEDALTDWLIDEE